MLAAFALAWPPTKAEATNYHATSTYVDVVNYVKGLEDNGAPLSMHFIGKSTEGRPIPLVVVSDPPVSTQEEARKEGKLVVYIEANIHAGEVEGKEAVLAIMRRLAIAHEKGEPSLLNDLVLVINPIYNSDGNEKWGPVAVNRPEQDGPDIVGLRANGQNLDLNRDCIKAESPEMKAALESVYKVWDPDAVLDLHTTDGTRHGYELTYAPGLNPNTDPAITAYTRDFLLPTVRHETQNRYGYDLFDYGNEERFNGATAWRSFGEEGRYVTNYAGLRNSVAVLSEATTFIPFKARIDATDHFVTMILDHLARDKDKIRAIRVDSRPDKEMGVRFDMKLGRTEGVILEKLASGEKKPLSGRPKNTEKVSMPVYDRFDVTQKRTVPISYIVPADQFATIRLLRMHGIKYSVLSHDTPCQVSAFTISECIQAPRPFQGHRLLTLNGTFGNKEITAPAYSLVVPTDQPLGRLAFNILEPESTDGVAAWGFLGDKLSGEYPIYRVCDAQATRLGR